MMKCLYIILFVVVVSDISNPNVENKEWLQSYVYICSGIGALLLIVVVVCVTVIRCRGVWIFSPLILHTQNNTQ